MSIKEDVKTLPNNIYKLNQRKNQFKNQFKNQKLKSKVMSKEKVIVEKFLERKEGQNPDYTAALVRVTTQHKNALNVMLGSDGFTKSKTAVQTLSNSVIEANGIKEGTNLGEALGLDLRIKRIDSFEDAPGFQELRAGADGDLITSGGKQVYFKNEVAEAGEEDIIFEYDAPEASEAPTAIKSEEEAM